MRKGLRGPFAGLGVARNGVQNPPKDSPRPCCDVDGRAIIRGGSLGTRGPSLVPLHAHHGEQGEEAMVRDRIMREALPQTSPTSIDETVISAEANDTTTWAAHRFDKIFPANEINCSNMAVTVSSFNLAKLTARNIVRILIFINAGFKDLRLKHLKYVIRDVEIVHFGKLMILRQKAIGKMLEGRAPIVA